METIDPEVFKVSDGEVITIDVRKTGAQTLFGVSHTAFKHSGPLTDGEPLNITMSKDDEMEDSTEFSNGKFTTITLTFSFNTQQGGQYDWTMSGSQGGTFQGISRQAGGLAKSVTFFIHIV
jgi:hypothetical protein